MTCDQRRDLLLLYVADALDADEAVEMRRHLQGGCPECAGYLAEAQAVMSAVPLGLEPVAPPPHLKEKLLRRIATEEAAQPSATVRPGGMRLVRYLIPAAVAAGIAIVATHELMMQRVNDLQRQAMNWQQKSSDAISQIQQLQQLRGQFKSQTQVVELLQSPDVRLIPLKSTPLQPNAVANLLWDQKQHQWAILASGMTPAAAGQTYELWFVTKAGQKIEAGTFDVDAGGTASLRVPIPAGIGPLKLAAVTNEKAGGVPQPQGNFQVLGSVE